MGSPSAVQTELLNVSPSIAFLPASNSAGSAFPSVEITGIVEPACRSWRRNTTLSGMNIGVKIASGGGLTLVTFVTTAE